MHADDTIQFGPTQLPFMNILKQMSTSPFTWSHFNDDFANLCKFFDGDVFINFVDDFEAFQLQHFNFLWDIIIEQRQINETCSPTRNCDKNPARKINRMKCKFCGEMWKKRKTVHDEGDGREKKSRDENKKTIN